jgi:hypothetical protein
MNVKFNFEHENLDRVVYVRAVDVSELPADVQAQLSEEEHVYAIHSEDGEQLRWRRTARLRLLWRVQTSLRLSAFTKI